MATKDYQKKVAKAKKMAKDGDVDGALALLDTEDAANRATIEAMRSAQTAAPAQRVFKAGTKVVADADRRPGSNHPVTAEGSRIPVRLLIDTPVEFDGSDRDEVFVGIIAATAENFALNIGSVPGKWSPTGVRLPNECGVCGTEIPPAAANQTTCAACIAKTTQTGAGTTGYEGTEHRVGLKDRRIQVVPLNDATERRVGAADRRETVAPKKAATKAAAKKAAAAKVK